MTDKAYQRTPVYALEKPLSGDIDQSVTQLDLTIRENLWREHGAPTTGMFMRNGFQPSATSPASMSVNLAPGLAFQYNGTDVPLSINGQSGLDDPHPFKPVVLSTLLNVVVPTAPGTNSRIDLIEVQYTRALDNLQSRQFLNTTTDSFSPSNVAKTLDPIVDTTLAYYAAAATPTTALAYKQGVPGASPSAPAVDTGYMAIAYIVVGTNVTTIVAANITDQRALMPLGKYLGRQVFSATGTYTPTPGARQVKVRMVGGGGGGGPGAATGASQASIGSGGQSGQYAEWTLLGATAPQGAGTIPITGGTVTVGAAGASSGNGGTTSAVVNGTTYSVGGGNAGVGQGPGSPTLGANTNPNVTAVANSPDLVTWGDGSPGFAFGSSFGSFTEGSGGNGGSSPFGAGGAGGQSGGAAGAAAMGFGGGGGGAFNSASATAILGGAGTAGLVIIDEWS
jgi:hypothetical protein